MLRNEFIVVNNSNNSLFSIPANLRFVYYNLNDKLREDPLLKSVEMLHELIQKPNFAQDDEDLDDLLPFKVSFQKIFQTPFIVICLTFRALVNL